MAQKGTGVADFSKKINDFLTNDVGDDILNFKDDDKFTNFLNKWIEKWRTSLETAKHGKYTGHIASGNLYQRLGDEKSWTFTTLGKRVQIQFVLPDYYKFTDDKRNPTSGGGNGALRRALGFQNEGSGWIANKRLIPSSGMELFGRKLTAAQANKALSFLIARKIHRDGYKGSGWFSKDMNKFKEELTSVIEKLFGKGASFNLKILGK